MFYENKKQETMEIAKLCKKLENLSFQEMNLQNRSLALLAHSCPNLKSFAMEDCTNCHEGEVISLIKRCPTLESISMKRNMSLRGYWLKQLRQPLRRLSLNACQFNPAHLIQGIINVKDSLKELNLTACYTIRCSDLDIITGYLPGLVSLKLAGVFPDFKAHTLSHISKLKSLVKLNLERNLVVCDDFIQDLLDNCPNISTINLSCTDSSLLSQGGLCLVAKFPALTHLALAYLSRLTDSTLKTIAQEASNLRRLNLTGCTSVTDDGCTSVVSLCHSLEHLDISGCHSVTKATVSSAIKSAKMGIKKTKLTIVIGESGVDLESNWESPHVNIDRNSNCAQYGLESDEHLFFFDLMDNEVQFLNPGAYDVLNFYDVDALDFDEPFDYDVWSDDSNYSDESFEY
ncbi:hypothetical protein AAG570_003820 [Ranatra chinensis]|uniref:Uncharacterized protein n=1 Tax=Ranatra chinensis TaxID=642074 RepID=A0ABD0Y227_9HEMI